MCNCIKTIRAVLRQNDKITNVHLGTSFYKQIEELGKPDEGIEKPGKLTISYNKVLSGGRDGKKRYHTFLTFDFCPFCGEKYRPEEPTTIEEYQEYLAKKAPSNQPHTEPQTKENINREPTISAT